ncbi:MAG TPA: hypothetical protein VN176_06470 [Verrucomicrobiae bacterium]|jgi:hypothetical protein|nr:hypothetical protein [Verrucomicrobiae bacterium]
MLTKSLIVSTVVSVLLVGGFFLFRMMHPCPHLPRRMLQTVFYREYVPADDIIFRWTMSASVSDPHDPGGRLTDMSVYEASIVPELTANTTSFRLHLPLRRSSSAN